MEAKNKYQIGKEKARHEAIEYSNGFNEKPKYYSELADDARHFRKLGKRYGLIREFEENGIL